MSDYTLEISFTVDDERYVAVQQSNSVSVQIYRDNLVYFDEDDQREWLHSIFAEPSTHPARVVEMCVQRIRAPRSPETGGG